MTDEEKQFLLKDISARIPYQPLCKIIDTEYDFCECDRSLGYSLRDLVGNNIIIKPYLRPMSNMTEEEREEFRGVGGVMSYSPQHDSWAISSFAPEAYDWLNSHHFDFRGLIQMGLALEATEGMYK